VGIRLFLFAYSQVAGVALRKSGKCFSAIHRPPGFAGMNLTLPRATREAFGGLDLIFSQLPFSKGGKIGIIYRIPQELSSL
jgi:hypothetical protein